MKMEGIEQSRKQALHEQLSVIYGLLTRISDNDKSIVLIPKFIRGIDTCKGIIFNMLTALK